MLNTSRATVGWHMVEGVVGEHLPERFADGNMIYSGVLFGLAAVAQPRVIVEIGTQYGISTRMWLAATAPTGGVVHSIDVDAQCGEGETRGDIDAAGWLSRWHFHHGRSQDIEPIESDLLYVDGDHSYEAVRSDMARHGRLVRDGGLVVLDDYYVGWPGKMQWVNERWDVLQPIIIGPTAVVRVTPAKRAVFG